MAKKDPQPLLKEKKNGGEFKRGALLCVLILFYSERASCFCFCFAATLLYEDGNAALVFYREE